jgi:hypothetical protein
VTGVVAYRLEPVPGRPAGDVASAAVMTCVATGEILCGAGGGGEFLSPGVVAALRSGASRRVVCDADLFDDLVTLARMAARGEDATPLARRIASDDRLADA